MQKKNSLHNTLLQGLLNLSDDDASISKQLLNNAGIDPNRSSENTLKNIEKFKSELQSRIANDSYASKVDLLLQKLKVLLKGDSEKFSQYLSTLTIPSHHHYAFKTNRLIDKKNLIDLDKLEGLIVKLENEGN